MEGSEQAYITESGAVMLDTYPSIDCTDQLMAERRYICHVRTQAVHRQSILLTFGHFLSSMNVAC